VVDLRTRSKCCKCLF